MMRSNSALHSRGFGITCVHSENGKFVVTITAAFSARSAITWNRNSAPRSCPSPKLDATSFLAKRVPEVLTRTVHLAVRNVE